MKVISYKNLPVRAPTSTTAITWLLCDRFHVPEVVWGIVSTLVVALWVIYIVAVNTQEQVDLFEKR